MASFFSFDPRSIAEAEGSFRRIGTLLPMEFNQRGRWLFDQAARIIKEEAPRSNRVGDHFADQIGVLSFNQGNGTMRGDIAIRGNRAWLLPLIVGGTRPHIIRPRRPGGVLVFQVGGETVFARQVNHPGTRPNDFLTRAQRRIDALAQAEMNAIERRLASAI